MLFYKLHVSHNWPMYPGLHKHLKSFILEIQRAEFLQGLLKHGSVTSQLFPINPAFK